MLIDYQDHQIKDRAMQVKVIKLKKQDFTNLNRLQNKNKMLIKINQKEFQMQNEKVRDTKW